MYLLFSLSAVNREFDPRSSPTKDYTIDICLFSIQNITIRSQIIDVFVRSLDHVSEWIDMFNCELSVLLCFPVSDNPFDIFKLFFRSPMIPLWYLTQHDRLVEKNIIIIFSKRDLFLAWYSWQIDHFVLNNNYWLTSVSKLYFIFISIII
jgi:hypothetical protein